MKSRLKEKQEAIALRKKGLSYKEIMEQVSVSKSSLSGWFKHLELTDEETAVLNKMALENADNGRARATVSNRERRQSREEMAYLRAEELFEGYKNDQNFILGIGLYWAEGGKRTSAFQFMNSDPEMIRFMIFWTKHYLMIDTENMTLKVHTHEDFKHEKYEDFWSNITKIPLDQFRKTAYKPNRHGIYKKNPAYKGCVRLEVGGGVALLRTMVSLQKILAEDLKMLYLAV